MGGSKGVGGKWGKGRTTRARKQTKEQGERQENESCSAVFHSQAGISKERTRPDGA
jgi:hypothetical protein